MRKECSPIRSVNPTFDEIRTLDPPRVRNESSQMQSENRIFKRKETFHTGEKSEFAVIFVCVKYGVKYGPEYVNNLYHQLKKGSSAYYKMKKMKMNRKHKAVFL